MQILLCAATPFEIQPTVDYIKSQQVKSVEILITGVGLTAATYAITKAANQNKPDFIVQAGVAGSLDEEIELGKVVLIKDEMIGDSGVIQNGLFHSLFDLNLAEANEKPWQNQRLSNSIDVLKQSNLPIVNGVTVNEISTNIDRINYYKNKLNAQIESLEGAALHYVALSEGIKFLQLRSISNLIGERDKSKWQLSEAIMNLNTELQKIISKLANQ
jgi:futalosine hydrolase